MVYVLVIAEALPTFLIGSPLPSCSLRMLVTS